MRLVDVAIYGKLNADATLVTTYGSAGAFRFQAPQGTALPYVVFQQQSAVDDYAFKWPGRTGRSLVYLVKAVTVGHSGKVATQMAERIDALLTDTALSVTGYKVQRVRRESDVEYVETDEGVMYHHVGGLFRIDLEG